MICIGKKADGSKCGAQAQKDFLTCKNHRDQEPETTITQAPPVETPPTVTTQETAVFGSISANYAFVVQPRKTQEINGQVTETQASIRADFVEGRFTTDNPRIITALRDFIAKNPTSKYLFAL